MITQLCTPGTSDPDLSRADPELCGESAATLAANLPAEVHVREPDESTPSDADPQPTTSVHQPLNTSPHSRPVSLHIPSPEPFVDTNLPTAEPTPQHPPSLLSPITEGPTAESFPTTATAERLQAFRSYWLSTFSEETSCPEFSAQCVAFTTQCVELSKDVTNTSQRRPAPRRPERPSARPPIDSRRPERFNPVEARRIQGLYKHSRKRAVWKVFNDDSPVFTGTTAEAQSFFSNIFGPKDCNTTRLVEELFTYVPTADTDDSLFATPSAAEIIAKLRAMANSAPGKDRVEYRHLRLLDPKGEILHLIYDRCFQQKDVPSPWKTATTILIHKKGPTNDVSNFRPIALMSCVYKLMMAILSKRMTTFAIDNDLLSAEQKSAQPSEGFYEHGYILQSIIGNARRLQKNVFLSWLDLRNAFGSVPHSAIFTTLYHMGFPEALVEMVRNVYTGATIEVRTDAGLTDTIPIHAGVKQGCPLSPILFNLALELVLRKIKAAATTNRRGPAKHHNIPISVLAYADDLVLITRDKANLQHLLDAASTSASLVGLQFRPDKCASLSYTNSKRVEGTIAMNEFKVQNQQIPPLGAEDHYKYLGIPIGLIHNINHLPEIVEELIPKLLQLEECLLAPWQKLDAIRTFIQPCLTYAFRAGSPTKKSLALYRSTLLRVIRKVCSLPQRSTTNYIFASRQAGGLGFQDPFLECDIQTVVHALKMLSSSDPLVAGIARHKLYQTVRHAAKAEPTPALVSNYLSASPDRRLENIPHRVQSLWSRTRKACRNLHVTIKVPLVAPANISTAEYVHPVLAPDACRFLHNITKEQFAAKLTELPDQGKVARALEHDKYSNGSSWHFTGLNMRFKDWRFIHKARLNCLSLNAEKSRWSETTATCRHCVSDETLPHVLCHCTINMVAIRQRHDKIVNRLVNAVRFGEVTTDRTVAETNSRVRPDIIFCEENGSESLDEAETRKVEKYSHLKEHFTSTGKRCEVYGFVIGALGTWHPSNERVLRKLGMTKSYKNLFRKLCCSDVIQGSTDIYRQHLGCAE